ncbi:ABC transporter substrate-binding protein [Sutterella sp.]|uniref:ABC transporter substrate-binding protein n=1 Tax=Sutterella sp. TaxID=1981025 RepID=UPI0026E041E0|nr:ABC transporter substrate-binding protein [Sutterella sp.]MDO5531540.1 ABC transporter substrate-binding protein [Sutterella sp.]
MYRDFFNAITRREFVSLCAAAAAATAVGMPRGVWAAEPERKAVTIAVGGKNLYYYLPMALADWMGFYKEEGLDVKVVDFQGGSKSLQAVVGGSADVVSGAFEHTLMMQTKRQRMTAFALQDRAPQCVFVMNKATMGNEMDPAKLKGKRIGVSAPGSSTHVIVNFVMQRAGVKPNEFSVIGVGTGAGAVAAIRAGQIDAMVCLDPVITQLTRDNAISIVTDTRVIEESDALYGGPMVGGCLYAPEVFVKENPETCQRLTNALIRSLKMIEKVSPEELMKHVPKAAFLGNPGLYADCFLNNRRSMSTDGRFPQGCVETAAKALASVTPKLAEFQFDAAACFTNKFADASPQNA